ncbi:MAG: hypothetical protein M1812_005376 [Candelaria pacifica]|nr:MAG: hypothetical protein M1812_005376 [Candelaria pacifica]
MSFLNVGVGAYSLSKRFDIVCLPSAGDPPFPIDDCNDALNLMENTQTLASYEPSFYGSAFLSAATVGRTNALYIPLLGNRGTNNAGDRFTIPRTYSYGECSIGLNFIQQYSTRDGSPLPNRPDHDFVDQVREAAKEIMSDCGQRLGQGGGTRVEYPSTAKCNEANWKLATSGVEHRINIVVWKTEGPSGKEMRRINSMRALIDCPFVNSEPVREGSVESCVSIPGTPSSGDSGTCHWSGGSIDTSYAYSQTYCTATDTSNCCEASFCRPVVDKEQKGESMMQMMFGMKPALQGTSWAETIGMCLMSTVASLGSSLTPREEEGYG